MGGANRKAEVDKLVKVSDSTEKTHFPGSEYLGCNSWPFIGPFAKHQGLRFQ